MRKPALFASLKKRLNFKKLRLFYFLSNQRMKYDENLWGFRVSVILDEKERGCILDEKERGCILDEKERGCIPAEISLMRECASLKFMQNKA